MIRSQSFTDPVTLGYDLHKCFSSSFSMLVESGRRKVAGVGLFPFSKVCYVVVNLRMVRLWQNSFP